MKRGTAWALLGLVAIACTRPNPAFEPGAADPEDAEWLVDEPPPPDAAVGSDLASPAVDADFVPAPDAGAADAMARPLAPDASAPDVSAPDTGPPDDASLVGYWPADEGTGALLDDLSGNGNRGSLAGLDLGTVWKPGHAGSALEIPALKGAAVLVNPSPSLDRGSRALTISAWVYRLESIRNHNMTVASRQMGSASRELYNLGFQSDALVVWLYAAEPAAEVSVRATITAPLNKWIHVAMTWDGTTARLYQDGAQVAAAAYAGPLPATANPVILGNNANSTGIDQPLGGRLDEVRLYDRALPAAEIANLAR